MGKKCMVLLQVMLQVEAKKSINLNINLEEKQQLEGKQQLEEKQHQLKLEKGGQVMVIEVE